MASPLEGALRRTIGKAMSSTFYACTVTRSIPGSTDPPYSPWAPGPPTLQPHACKGLVDGYSVFERTNTLIVTGDVKVLILASTLAITPTTSDTVTIRGTTYSVIDVSTDPAQALWVLQARV